MIPKKFRTPTSLFLQKPRNRIFSEYFQVKAFPNKFNYNRFGAVVGTKVDKRSSARHFWKRLILNTALRQKNLSSDFIITAMPGLKEVSKEKARADLSEIFRKLERNK